LTKPFPLTVSVKAAPPCTTVAGLRLISSGNGFGAVIVKLLAGDVPPPGAGLVTVTLTVPVEDRSVALTLAVNWVELTKVVGRAAPFQRTSDPEIKLVPLTVSVKAPLFWTAEAGARLAICGTGLLPLMLIVPLLSQVIALALSARIRLLLVSVKITSLFCPMTMPTVSGN
jgi:hypothetical protein